MFYDMTLLVRTETCVHFIVLIHVLIYAFSQATRQLWQHYSALKISRMKVYSSNIPHMFYDDSPRTNSFARTFLYEQRRAYCLVRTETCVRFNVLMHVLIYACS